MSVAALTGQAKAACALCTARWNIWDGAVRSGKTVSSLLAWLRFVREGPAGPLLMVGKTERTLTRNIIDPLVGMLGVSRCKLIAGTGELWLLGRKVYVVGANDERAQEKIRGLTLAGAYVDEASTLPESFWTMLASRLSLPGAQAFATTNPDGPRHWLKVNYLDKAAVVLRDGRIEVDRRPMLADPHQADVINLHRFRFRLDDNPTLEPTYKIDLLREYVGLWRRRMIDGEWAVASGVIYDMFDEDRHVVRGNLDIRRLLALGLDHGATNPTAGLMLAQLRDRRLALVREFRHDPKKAHTTLTVSQLTTRLTDWLGDDRPKLGVCVDPAAKVLKDQLRHDGLAYRDADNDVLQGIRLMSSLLANDQLVIHDSCTGLLDELPVYAWDPKAAERGEDKPLKASDHSADAARYACATSSFLWRTDPVTIARPPRKKGVGRTGGIPTSTAPRLGR